MRRWVQQALNVWQRILVVFVCLALVITRLVFPTLTVDWITVCLIAIATLAILLPSYARTWPQIARALPYIKKARVLGVEVEFTEEIKKLSRDIEQAKESLSAKRFSLGEVYTNAQSEVLAVVKTDPRAALLVLAARIEQVVAIRLAQHGLRKQGMEIPLRQAIDVGVRQGVFPAEVLTPFNEFWELRNRIAHGRAFEVDDSIVLSLVSVGLEVLKLVSLEESDGSSNQK